MKMFGVALMNLSIVILIVSLAYIIITTRHKEKMKLLDKDLDPKKYMNDRFAPNTLRAGLLLFGVGIGFLTALILDEYVLTTIDNPAIYAGSVMLFGGLSLLIFHKVFGKKYHQ